jgi:hypothetical protein
MLRQTLWNVVLKSDQLFKKCIYLYLQINRNQREYGIQNKRLSEDILFLVTLQHPSI